MFQSMVVWFCCFGTVAAQNIVEGASHRLAARKQTEKERGGWGAWVLNIPFKGIPPFAKPPPTVPNLPPLPNYL
jgi:hypothetical protein